MKTRLLALLLALVLLASACGVDDDLATVDDTATSTTTSTPVDEVDAGGGRGWIDGEPTPGEAAGGLDAAAGDADAALDRSESATYGDEAEPFAPEPPIDPLPPADEPLRAGSIDDADDVAAYLAYRESVRAAGIEVRPLDVSDSTVFRVVGANGLPVLGAEVRVSDPDGGTEPVVLRTRADGTVRFLPHTLDPTPTQLDVIVAVGDRMTEVDGLTIGADEVTVVVDPDGGHDGPVPLDIVFVLDATGSMGDEIERLRDNMTSVARQIDALPSAPDVRFGMTVYRDVGDAFVTRTFDLTDSLADFLDALDLVSAEGGGDYPEAMDEALHDALTLPAWRSQGAVQLMFLIADAPPQVGRPVPVGYAETAVAAAAQGVKIFPVAASGTDDQAEYVMRELAFVTGGRFVFLSYGAGGAATGSGTDITPDDYDELPLDELIVQLVEDELAALADVEPGQAQTTTVPPTTTAPPSTTVPIDGQ